MDETYVKMCDCPEIQEGWKRKTGDWFYAKENLGDRNDTSFIHKGDIVCSGDIADFSWESSCDFGGGIEDFSNAIWLPRQDQLQEMYADYVANELGMVKQRGHLVQGFIDFSVWLEKQYHDENFTCFPTNVFDSGEQLWLAFYMKQQYGKVWSGSEWVKDE